MGTNYYLRLPTQKCPTCGHGEDVELHIGKSSGGWCFALHVVPERGLNTLNDWRNLWDHYGEIRNEYGDVVTREDLEDIITKRSWPREPEAMSHYGPYAERGPGNLMRHKTDGVHCIGHGDGTWDYIQGEFS